MSAAVSTVAETLRLGDAFARIVKHSADGGERWTVAFAPTEETLGSAPDFEQFELMSLLQAVQTAMLNIQIRSCMSRGKEAA